MSTIPEYIDFPSSPNHNDFYPDFNKADPDPGLPSGKVYQYDGFKKVWDVVCDGGDEGSSSSLFLGKTGDTVDGISDLDVDYYWDTDVVRFRSNTEVTFNNEDELKFTINKEEVFSELPFNVKNHFSVLDDGKVLLGDSVNAFMATEDHHAVSKKYIDEKDYVRKQGDTVSGTLTFTNDLVFDFKSSDEQKIQTGKLFVESDDIKIKSDVYIQSNGTPAKLEVQGAGSQIICANGTVETSHLKTQKVNTPGDNNLLLQRNGINKITIGEDDVSFDSPVELKVEGTEDSHAVTKKYIDDLLANVDFGDKVDTDGDTMSGNLELPQLEVVGNDTVSAAVFIDGNSLTTDSTVDPLPPAPDPIPSPGSPEQITDPPNVLDTDQERINLFGVRNLYTAVPWGDKYYAMTNGYQPQVLDGKLLDPNTHFTSQSILKKDQAGYLYDTLQTNQRSDGTYVTILGSDNSGYKIQYGEHNDLVSEVTLSVLKDTNVHGIFWLENHERYLAVHATGQKLPITLIGPGGSLEEKVIQRSANTASSHNGTYTVFEIGNRVYIHTYRYKNTIIWSDDLFDTSTKVDLKNQTGIDVEKICFYNGELYIFSDKSIHKTSNFDEFIASDWEEVLKWDGFEYIISTYTKPVVAGGFMWFVTRDLTSFGEGYENDFSRLVVSDGEIFHFPDETVNVDPLSLNDAIYNPTHGEVLLKGYGATGMPSAVTCLVYDVSEVASSGGLRSVVAPVAGDSKERLFFNGDRVALYDDLNALDLLVDFNQDSVDALKDYVDDNLVRKDGDKMSGKLEINKTRDTNNDNSFVIKGRIRDSNNSLIDGILFKDYQRQLGSNSPDYITYYGTGGGDYEILNRVTAEKELIKSGGTTELQSHVIVQPPAGAGYNFAVYGGPDTLAAGTLFYVRDGSNTDNTVFRVKNDGKVQAGNNAANAFIATEDNDLTTKKYVDDAVASGPVTEVETNWYGVGNPYVSSSYPARLDSSGNLQSSNSNYSYGAFFPFEYLKRLHPGAKGFVLTSDGASVYNKPDRTEIELGTMDGVEGVKIWQTYAGVNIGSKVSHIFKGVYVETQYDHTF